MIYVASPYSDPSRHVMEDRYFTVAEYCARLISKGEFPYSPIVYGHNLAILHDLPTDAAFWWEWNAYMMRCCNALHIYHIDGWDRSVGVAQELAYATEIGLSIVHVDGPKTA